MATLKVIEVLAESPKSWEDAAQVAVQKAAVSVHNIKSVYIQEFLAVVEKDRITSFRVDAKISFALD
jgi:flavin-binding protein dodecin